MNNSRVRGSISDMVSFIKERTIENVVNCKNTNQIDITDADLRTLANVIDNSVTQAFIASIDTVEKSLSG